MLLLVMMVMEATIVERRVGGRGGHVGYDNSGGSSGSPTRLGLGVDDGRDHFSLGRSRSLRGRACAARAAILRRRGRLAARHRLLTAGLQRFSNRQTRKEEEFIILLLFVVVAQPWQLMSRPPPMLQN